MEIIEQRVITDPIDILSLDIIDFNRLNGCWKNSGDALKTIFSWFRGVAVYSIVVINNFHDAPKRGDWPGWEHCGGHSSIGEDYWNWFFWNHPNGRLVFSDSPDFWGVFDDGQRFWGDIGKVSASAFAMTQKGLSDHDLWISIPGSGKRQVLIEPLINISELYACRAFNEDSGDPIVQALLDYERKGIIPYQCLEQLELL